MSAPHYQIIRRPIITEKGLGVKETEDVRTANFHGKMRRRGQNEGYRRDWKKAYVKLAEGEKMIEYAENL